MTAIDTVRTPATEIARPRASILGALVSAATGIAILGVALLPLLTPLVLHPLLDASTSSAWLGVPAAQVHQLSDTTVSELVFGPGTFAFAGANGPAFYDASEASHLRDARNLLLIFEALTAVSVVFVAWSALRRGAAGAVRRGAKVLIVGVLIVGVVGFFAFEPAFELFHQVFFPGGNWAFDPRSSHMVQLYPYDFWQVTATALGAITIALAGIVWLMTRSRRTAPVA